MKVALIGAGYFGQFHIDAWRRAEGATLAAIVDPDLSKAEAARAAQMIRDAVNAAFAPGDLVTCEMGGDAGVAKVRDAVLAEIARADT